jgi:hypothetical protein
VSISQERQSAWRRGWGRMSTRRRAAQKKMNPRTAIPRKEEATPIVHSRRTYEGRTVRAEATFDPIHLSSRQQRNRVARSEPHRPRLARQKLRCVVCGGNAAICIPRPIARFGRVVRSKHGCASCDPSELSKMQGRGFFFVHVDCSFWPWPTMQLGHISVHTMYLP